MNQPFGPPGWGPEIPPRSQGSPGASFRREAERRRFERECRGVLQQPPSTGSALAVRASEAAVTQQGTTAEVRIARYLESRCSDRVLFLHDRVVPRGGGGVDLIAVAPSGVWVVGAEQYTSAKVRVVRPLRGPAMLRIGSEDRTALIARLARQVEAVEAVLRRLGHRLEPRGALCFLDGGLPLLRTLSLEGVALLYPNPLARRLDRDGPLHRERAELLAAQLAERLPPA